MKVASPASVLLFNYRGEDAALGNLVLVSGRKGEGGQSRDGVRALHTILKDAMKNHDQTCLKIPKQATIKLQSKTF